MSQNQDLSCQSPSRVQISQHLSQDVESSRLQSKFTPDDEDQYVDGDLSTPSQSIVDELFKDYISQKNMQVKSDLILPKKNIEPTSIEEMNALLDREIRIINTGTSSRITEVKHKNKHKKKRKSESHESRHVSKNKKIKNYRTQSDEDIDKYSSKSNYFSGSEKILKSELSSTKNDADQKNDSNEVVKTKGGLELLCQYSETKVTDSDLKSTVPIKNTTDSNNYCDASNDADALAEKGSSVNLKGKHTFNDNSVILPAVKPKLVNISVKISSDSAQFIASGETVDKKGKRREEGEVVTSGSENNCDSDYEDEDDDMDDDVNGSKISDIGSLPESEDDKSHAKSHKKKKHKHKHKKKKKYKNKDKSEDTCKGSKKSQERHGHDSSKRTHRERKYSKHDRSRSRSNSRSRSKTRLESNEVYDRGWDARSYSDDVKGQRNSSYFRDERNKQDKRYNSRSRSRSCSRAKSRWRSRSRSRSRSKSENKKSDKDLRLKIDKKKLRKIAMANVLANMRGVNSSDLVNIKSGGKSVEELTDFCKGLAGKDDDYSSSGSDSDGNLTDRDVDQPFIHHPFVIRDPPPIIMNIRNAKQIPVMTQSEKTVNALRSQFPVSSGNQHRLKELEWVPVEKTTAPTPTSTENVTVAKTFSLPVPVTTSTSTLPSVTPAPSTSQTLQVVSDPVFPQPVSVPIDIGAIVSERLQAVRKLQENPFDVQALSKMHKSQEKASQWAQSQYQPGQFTGSTGVQILTKSELEGTNKKNQAWLKRDQFKRAEPVKSGIGMFLLQKMGWKAGEGLGKNNEGSLEPLLLDLKVDRKGLQTQSEQKGNVKGVPKNTKAKGGGHTGPGGHFGAPGQSSQTLPKDLSGKHPVSALLELCNRRKYGAPYFELVHESGPDHKKNFLFKVLVNHVEYQPSITSNNKKTAKAQAATVCLQELGMLPRNGPI